MKTKFHIFSKRFYIDFMRNNLALIGLILLLIIGTAINPRHFLTIGNLSNVLRQSAIVGFLACGMTFVIICADIDLSISAIYACSAFISLYLVQYSLILAIIGPMAFGVLIGFANGNIINKMKVPPFVATLAVQLGLRGALLVISKGLVFVPENPISNIYKYLTSGVVLGYLPVAFLIMLAFYLLAGYILNKTVTGRTIFAVGGNEEAARMMGIKTEWVHVKAHILACFMASLSGIIFGSRVGSAYPDTGIGYEMYAVAATAIGGTLLSGGRGKMSGTFIGAMIMALLTNVFNMQSIVDSTLERVITGAILVAVLISQVLGKRITGVAEK